MATSPLVVGALLILCGSILVGGVLNAVDEWPSPTWWRTALAAPDVIGTAASIGVAAAILMAGSILRRHSWHRAPASALPEPDAVDAPKSTEPVSRTHRNAASVGALCLLGSVGFLVGAWFYAQMGTPTSQVSLVPGQATEYYRVPLAEGSLKQMLPRRLELISLQPGGVPQARVAFSPVGEESEEAVTLTPGQSLDADGLRISFTGMDAAASTPRGVFISDRAQTIEAAAGVGEEFRLEVDGPTFQVENVVTDYQGILGPAARVANDELGAFWVFQRGPQTDDAGGGTARFLHGLRLARVEATPAARLTISRVQPLWPLSASGVLALLGLVLLVLFPERIVRKVKGDEGRVEVHQWSLTEAGALYQERADEATS